MKPFDQDVELAGIPYPTDALLLDAVRAGDVDAYGELFRRHVYSARLAARAWTSQPAEEQDLVADAFASTLKAIRNGSGPQDSLRPYLMTTVRHLGIRLVLRRARTDMYGTEPHAGAALRDEGIPVEERVLRRGNLQLARSAFHSLPLRWRLVLWHTEVESASPAELASRLGMSPNGVAALAMRAREGLRQAYLQAQVPRTGAIGCAATRQRLGRWARGGLSGQRRKLVVRHLAVCRSCEDAAAKLAETNDEMHQRPISARPPK